MNTLNELEEFSLLTDFMAAFDPVVEPRGADLDESQRALLARIADGSSTEADRRDALPLLAGNTLALEFLALRLNDNG